MSVCIIDLFYMQFLSFIWSQDLIKNCHSFFSSSPISPSFSVSNSTVGNKYRRVPTQLTSLTDRLQLTVFSLKENKYLFCTLTELSPIGAISVMQCFVFDLQDIARLLYPLRSVRQLYLPDSSFICFLIMPIRLYRVSNISKFVCSLDILKEIFSYITFIFYIRTQDVTS